MSTEGFPYSQSISPREIANWLARQFTLDEIWVCDEKVWAIRRENTYVILYEGSYGGDVSAVTHYPEDINPFLEREISRKTQQGFHCVQNRMYG